MDTLLLLIGALALVALLLLIRSVRRRGDERLELERDRCGLWRYYRETCFERKAAYQGVVEERKPDKRASEAKVVAVLSFDGDIRARQHRAFAQLVDEVTLNHERLSEVVVVVTSPGGAVQYYGHVYAEMERLRNLGVPLTVCVDVFAASGGYLISLPANRIVAAPFAAVGSVGVAAFVPNIRRLLEEHSISPRTFTAGRLKRTVSMTDDATPEEIQHFQDQLEAIHRSFLDVVRRYRPQANLDLVATGDSWTAAESLELNLGLVDQIGTSNEYLLERNRESDLVFLSHRRSFLEESARFLSGGMSVLRSR